MNIVSEYIKYRLNAKGRHGIHSPYIYDLVDKCFRIHIPTADKRLINDFRLQQLKNNSVISIKDYGVGSKRMSNQRKVSSIFKNSASVGKYGDLLYRLVNFHQPAQILEFGTSLGYGTYMMSLANQDAQITTIEGCPETFKVAQQNLATRSNIDQLNATFNEFLANSLAKKMDFIYLDGHHDGNATLDYLRALEPWMHDETIILLDDIRWSNGMFEAWESLKNSNNYHVSIDLFRMGIIVPRIHQQKEHFVLKI